MVVNRRADDCQGPIGDPAGAVEPVGPILAQPAPVGCTSVADFLPGLDLAASFYEEVVEPRLAGIVHSAALMGPGSDVLGYDDLRSTDHFWGPRMQVFVDEADVASAEGRVEALPAEHRGWPTRIGSDRLAFRAYVDVHTVFGWFEHRLGVDPGRGMTALDWLVLPQQLLLEMTAGRIFSDGLGQLGPRRRALAWYPDDVWRWLLAAQWKRIGQEEAFVGRTAEIGDDLGSRVVTARLVRDLMRLCFLLERSYAPYGKWLGTAFARLGAAADVGPHLEAALAAAGYPEREAALVQAYEAVARLHNALGLTPPVDPAVRPFHDRPFLVLGADRFADACVEAVDDPVLYALPLVGGVDQWVDSTDVLSHGERVRRLIGWYTGSTR